MPRFVFLAMMLAVSAAAAQKKPVTVDAAAAARERKDVPSAPIWAPGGARFVYTQDGKAWLYDIPSRTRRKLFALPALSDVAVKAPSPRAFDWRNRNVREKQIQWLPSGNALLVEAGGDLFLFRLALGSYTRLTATAEVEGDPQVSPDGRRVSFRRAHELFVLELATGKVTQLTASSSETVWNAELDWVYPEELDLGTAHWWSPDSTRVAYLQFDVSRQAIYPHASLLGLDPVYEPQRYPRAGTPNAGVRLGVVPATGGPTRWMNTGDTLDRLLARVQWLPDSNSIAAVTLNRVQNRLDLISADAASGASRLLLRETSPDWVNVSDDLHFLPGRDEFLWSSERDGFRHLYVYTLDGKLARRLTTGDWEVSEVTCVNPAKGEVYYTARMESPLEDHLYVVGINGGAPRRLSVAGRTHAISMSEGAEYYLDSASSLTDPPRRTIHRSDGSELAVFTEADRKPIEEYEILPAEIVRVKAQDGASLYARLIKPAGFSGEKKYPAIVMVYGGPHAQAVRNAWAGVNFDQALAHRGFVVWQLDNRGSAGRGHAWEAALYRRLGARELEDQLAGVKHLISMGVVDPARIGIHGWSYGGFVTLYALLNAPETFKAGAAGAPVTDWRMYDTIYTERYLGLPAENEKGYQASSVIHSAAKLKGALLLLHNLEDDNVVFQHTLRMADELQRASKPFEMMLYPQKKHGVSGTAYKHLLETVASFFERRL
ncbi:MAG: S9 family peptidase [Acidobacteriales bacterium]|nr:S9 family peptidase [Terriglobales bacterium]